MLEEYRRQYAAFNTNFMREHYLFLSGQKESLQIATIYDRYGELFDIEAIDGLRSELENTPPHFETRRRSLVHLLLFAVEQFLENAGKHLTEKINDYESRASIQWNGRPMTFQDAAVALAVEPDRNIRRALFTSRASIIESSNDLRSERLAKIHEAARGLGFKSYRALFESLREIDYSTIADEIQRLLHGTETVLSTGLRGALQRKLGLDPGQAERFDAVYFLHLTDYDEMFPSEDLMQVYRQTMASLGVDVDAQSHITIDSEPRPRKAARAFCMPVSIPEEVKLVIRPSGGQSDYQSFLHESGHAQHYGWTSASLPPEFKYTGDYALTETYAFLFNHLVNDREWLAEFLGFSESEEFVRSVMLARLITIRRYAAKLLYELKLHEGWGLPEAASLYASLQTSATGFRTSPTDYLYDLDDGFYSAGYLRAWAFEVALRDHLKTRFGSRWWASLKAGTFLKELWETGDQYTADEVASQIGIGPISFGPLIEEFIRALQ